MPLSKKEQRARNAAYQREYRKREHVVKYIAAYQKTHRRSVGIATPVAVKLRTLSKKLGKTMSQTVAHLISTHQKRSK